MASTDLTGEEGSVRLNIRGSCGFAVNISKLDWKKIQAEEEFKAFISLVTQTQNALKFEVEEKFAHEDSSKLREPPQLPQAKPTNDVIKGVEDKKSKTDTDIAANTNGGSSKASENVKPLAIGK